MSELACYSAAGGFRVRDNRQGPQRVNRRDPFGIFLRIFVKLMFDINLCAFELFNVFFDLLQKNDAESV